jgi:D-sedoheptulose 7-phosphate isomerase
LKHFAQIYKKDLYQLIEEMDENVLEEIFLSLKEAEKRASRVFVIGNGGSAATASHMVNDLGVGLSRRGIAHIDIESLSDNIATCSALANDIGYEYIYSTQLQTKLKKDDILIAISCSGNSKNIINAVNIAHKKDALVIGLSGFDGGELKKISDISFHIQTEQGSYGLVEDIHMIVNHMLYSYFIAQMT